METTKENFKYWAFISYSHHDQHWGKWLHRALESRKLPSSLVGTRCPAGNVPKRLYPVFRDRDELSSASDLGDPLRKALRQSRSLIVICSPNSAASNWVNDEILYFQQLGRADSIHCLIVDGEPGISRGMGLEPDECFAPALRFRMVDGEPRPLQKEPIAADARDNRDSRRNALIKIIAGVLGLPYDQLRQRDSERRNRFLLAVSSSAGLLSVVMALLTWFALNSRDDALDNQADLLFNSAAYLAEKGEGREAARNLIEAIELKPDHSTAVARLTTLLTQHLFPLRNNDMKLFDGRVWKMYRSPDNRLLVVLSDAGRTSFVDMESGLPWDKILDPGKVSAVAFAGDGKRVAFATEEPAGIVVYDTRTREKTFELPRSNRGAALSLSGDGRYLAADRVWELGASVPRPLFDIANHESLIALYFLDQSDSLLAVHEDGSIGIRPIADLDSSATIRLDGTSRIAKSALSDDQQILITTGEFGQVLLRDVASGKIRQRFELSSQVSELVYRDGLLYAGTVAGEVNVWDARNRRLVSRNTYHKGAISNIDVQAGRSITASWDGTAQLSSEGMPYFEPMRHDGTVYSVSPGIRPGQIFTGGIDGHLYQWQYGEPAFEFIRTEMGQTIEQAAHSANFDVVAVRADNGKELSVLTDGQLRVFDGPDAVIYVAVAPDGESVIWLSDAGMLHLAARGDTGFEERREILLDEQPWRVMAADRWDRLIFQDDPYRFRLWSLVDNLPLGLEMNSNSRITQVLAIGKLDLVIGVSERAAGQASVKFWDYRTGLPYPVADSQSIRPGQLVYENQHVMSLDKGRLSVYRIQLDQRLSRDLPPKLVPVGDLHHSEDISIARLSVSANLVLTCSLDGTLRFWRLDALESPSHTLNLGSPAYALDISADGRWLIVGTQNGRVRVLETGTTREISENLAFRDALVYTRFDTGARRMLAMSSSGELVVAVTNLHLDAGTPAWLPDFARQLVGLASPGSAASAGDSGSDEWRRWRDSLQAQTKDSTRDNR